MAKIRAFLRCAEGFRRRPPIYFLKRTCFMKIDVKILDPRMAEQLPTYATPAAPAWTCAHVWMRPSRCSPTRGNWCPRASRCTSKTLAAALILPRSGLGHKHGIVLGNLVGLIDSDYQGQLMVSAWNRSDVAFTIEPMERLAQMVIVPVVQAQFNVVTDFVATERGAGGYGSTGTA